MIKNLKKKNNFINYKKQLKHDLKINMKNIIKSSNMKLISC